MKTKKEVQSLEELLTEVTQNKGSFVKFDFGKLSNEEAEYIEEKTGLNLKEYSRCIDSYGVNHVTAHHSNSKIESKRGQIAITIDDFKAIPLIISQADEIQKVGKNSSGRDLIKYTKTIDDTFHYVEEVRNGKKELVLQTLYKRKK